MHGLAYSGEQWASAVSHFDRNDELITCLSGSHEIQLLRQAASLLSIGPGEYELRMTAVAPCRRISLIKVFNNVYKVLNDMPRVLRLILPMIYRRENLTG